MPDVRTFASRGIAIAAGAALCLLSSGLPASAAQDAGRPPAVESFRASPASLPAGGGKVQLSAAVRRGTACVFTSSPQLPGLPARVSCTGGTAARTISLPANKAPSQKAYNSGMAVTAPAG